MGQATLLAKRFAPAVRNSEELADFYRNSQVNGRKRFEKIRPEGCCIACIVYSAV